MASFWPNKQLEICYVLNRLKIELKSIQDTINFGLRIVANPSLLCGVAVMSAGLRFRLPAGLIYASVQRDTDWA